MAATPPSSIAPPSPVVADSRPTACSPAMLPTAPANPRAASAVARARVGKSSPDHAPKTGVAALANPLQSTLPVKNPTVPVAKLRLVAAPVATVSTMAGRRRP